MLVIAGGILLAIFILMFLRNLPWIIAILAILYVIGSWSTARSDELSVEMAKRDHERFSACVQSYRKSGDDHDTSIIKCALEPSASEIIKFQMQSRAYLKLGPIGQCRHQMLSIYNKSLQETLKICG